MRYAEVVAPLPLDNTFTYAVPEAWEATVELYCLVRCSLGANRYFTGIVVALHDELTVQGYKIKELTAVVNCRPLAAECQLKLWKWIASYYLCSQGEVFKAAMPSVLMTENAYRPKTETFIRLPDSIRTEEALNSIIAALHKAPQQEKALLTVLDRLSSDSVAWKDDTRSAHSAGSFFSASIAKSELSIIPPSAISALVKKGFLIAEEKQVSRICSVPVATRSTSTLTERQQTALMAVIQSFEKKDITLLHGVHSSGKTEIFIHLIAETIANGRQALYLLPEKAVTMQITERLRKLFGERLFIYHSGCSDNERAELWLRLLSSDEPCIVLGMRSAVFLPYAKLGLVVVDEEQDSSYKQQEPTPRYNARNVAMVLARQHGAKTLLASAAPSLESYIRASQGIYGFVKLTQRYGEAPLPEVIIADVRELKRKWRMRNTMLSPQLIAKMTEALADGAQVILFQNRRGFAPVIICNGCGASPRCPNCDVCLTVHKQSNRLACHYCGYTAAIPSRCSQCGSLEMSMQGSGTEKIEEEVAALFPEVQTVRLDIDSARTPNDYLRIIKDFEDGKTKVLIGTQMIVKGLDFANVAVVGILNADQLLNAPDYRAYERTFQMLVQLGGRAGRRNRRGTVVLQTYQADNPILQAVCAFDYSKMAVTQLHERNDFRYPPYTRMIYIILRGTEPEFLDHVAELFAEQLKKRFDTGVSMPAAPIVGRIKTMYIRHIMLKTDLAMNATDVRQRLKAVQDEMTNIKGFNKILLYYDVDPV
jgi:primosomal protein N' (replication factor Y)